MAYSKNPDRYPEFFGRMFAKAREEQVELDLGSVSSATNLIHRLHAFRRALEETRRSGWREAQDVVIRREGTKVIAENKNKEWEAMLGTEIKDWPRLGQDQEEQDEQELKTYESEVDIFNKYLESKE